MGDDTIRVLARNVGLSPPVSGHDNVQDAVAAGGGGGSGNVIVRHFPFAFNTPGILTGAALYTPTIGDILLDAWIEIDTAWDGTTPLADIGTFIGSAVGVFGATLGAAIDMTGADTEGWGGVGSGIKINDHSNLDVPIGLGGAMVITPATTSVNARPVPAIVTAAHPIKVCVSQNGQNTGADPGSSHGAGIVYLVTATPS